MNTKIYINSLVAVALAATMAGCDENAWNDHLDGFEEKNDQPTANQQSIEYTLTDADYASIASNSTNVALAGADLKAALQAVGTRKAFSGDIPAQKYVPAFLESTAFPYFTLTDGSSVKLTYRVEENLPAELAQAAAAQLYTVSEDDYKEVWESDEDFVASFAPSHPASKYLARILKANADAAENEWCVVNYETSSQEPVFGSTGTQPEKPWEETSVIGSITLNDNVDIQGVVTAICNQGYIVTDKSGSVFVYMGSSFDASSVQIGNQLNISGTVGAYNKGFQITGSTATVEVIGQQEVKYPAAKAVSGAELEQLITRTDNQLGMYVTMTGKTVVSGNNINITLDGAEKAMGSVYQGTAAQKAAFTDGADVTVTGYFIAIAGGRYASIVVTDVNGKPVANAPRRKAAAASVPTTGERALYHFVDGAWTVASDFVVLNPADYTSMGQQYQNLTNANAYLPTFLRQKYPYAQAEDVKNVMYLYYNSSSKETYYLCDQYSFNGSEWTLNSGITTVTEQFVKSQGKWMYDPCVTITLPGGRNQELSMLYFQTCVDWVYENICVPLGDTSIKSGKFYVSSYGNNEYYCGTSAYQGNIDLRADKAREQYPAGYEGMSDEQIIDLMKSRFMNEVMPGTLATLHPDAKPVDGVDVIYTINFAVYTGSTTEYTARFKVTAPGKFEPIDCTWDAAE